MSFTSEKLYNGYLRKNLAIIVSTVNVREIVVHLPCLTLHDREIIEAKRETNGNFDAMVVLLECLKRRENWPEQFIDALEACEHPTIAAEMRAAYDALKGTNNSNPSSPPTTVVRAHVHPAPSARDLPVSENGCNDQAAVAAPAAQPPPSVETSTQPQAPQSPEEQAPEAVSPPEPVPEPVPEPPQAAQIEVPRPPSTPPPSPEIAHAQVNEEPLPQTENNSHQEPEENSEPDVQVINTDAGVGSENDEVSVNPVTNTQPVESDAPSCADSLQTTVTTEDEPPNLSPTQVNSSNDSSFPTLTPEKPPVQDTTPPDDKICTPVLQPEEISEPPAAQVAESSLQTEVAASSSPEPVAAAFDIAVSEDNSVCLSKPGNLVSVLPQDHGSPVLPAPSSPVEPYSGNSERLEISEADTVMSAPVAVCSTEDTVTAPLCQEQGFAASHNEPEENHYESPCGSLETQEVLENVIRVSEQPSILNLDGQTTIPQAQIVNGELAKDTTSASPSATAGDTASGSKPSEPAAAEAAQRTPLMQSVNTKYILTAAGVGACALLVAWRFKH
ncbi:mitochondrial antiviral-signaling protein [Parambassis ranga]|uniref:Mitochondrial antiviral-signaling protein n=1 Tax=Parambassis ranga TaxID=210632 RepID=A0A6P7HGD1_9TELE|nr:mitochondrial antiviral-signaling protein [Parambassis ranga]